MAGGDREGAPSLAWRGAGMELGAPLRRTVGGQQAPRCDTRVPSQYGTLRGATRPHCPPRELCAWAGEMSTGVQRCRESKRPVVSASRLRPPPAFSQTLTAVQALVKHG